MVAVSGRSQLFYKVAVQQRVLGENERQQERAAPLGAGAVAVPAWGCRGQAPRGCRRAAAKAGQQAFKALQVQKG
jgi:hypothetical protein